MPERQRSGLNLMKIAFTRRWFSIVAGATVLFVILCGSGIAQDVRTPSRSDAETLVGTGNKVQIVEKNGAVREVPKQDLMFLNRSSAPPRSAKPAAEPVKQEKEETAETGANKAEGKAPEAREETPAPPKARTAKPGAKSAKSEVAERAAKEKAEAIKRADIEKLREREKEGGWFYDKDGKPLSQEELDKRIEARDIGGIKSVDIHLGEWKTRTKPQAADEKK